MYSVKNDRGSLNTLLIPFIMVILLLIGAAAFGLWAYMERSTYKNDVDQKIDAAVVEAKREEGIAKDKAFAEAEKNPLQTYVGPEPFGSVQVTYPKTWSGYVRASGIGSQPLDGYFHPDVVPATDDAKSVFALRVQVVAQSYSSVITSMNSMVKGKTVTATPFSFPKVPTEVGTRFEGQIKQGKKLTGTLLVVPLRDKTLQIWTESPTFQADLNTLVIPNVTFVP